MVSEILGFCQKEANNFSSCTVGGSGVGRGWQMHFINYLLVEAIFMELLLCNAGHVLMYSCSVVLHWNMISLKEEVHFETKI